MNFFTSLILTAVMTTLFLHPVASAKEVKDASRKNEKIIYKFLDKTHQRYEGLSDKRKLKLLKRSKKRLLRMHNKKSSKIRASVTERNILVDLEMLHDLKIETKEVDKRAIIEDSLHIITDEITNLEYKTAQLPLELRRGIASVLLIVIAVVVIALLGFATFYATVIYLFARALGGRAHV